MFIFILIFIFFAIFLLIFLFDINFHFPPQSSATSEFQSSRGNDATTRCWASWAQACILLYTFYTYNTYTFSYTFIYIHFYNLLNTFQRKLPKLMLGHRMELDCQFHKGCPKAQASHHLQCRFYTPTNQPTIRTSNHTSISPLKASIQYYQNGL